ncbi:hypothetical protein O3G_MSEX009384 [Manduca sexta]|nr:hypothetical protein O3G_MSEX009384 [Manduca sexta]
MIALGAEASFKTKLFWIWTEYVKKFQNKEDIGLSQKDNEITIFTEDVEKDVDKTDDLDWQKSKKKHNSRSPSDISTITSGLLVAMLYTALNLDKSPIQISHLYRFIDEGRLIMNNFDRHIPEDVNAASISDWTKFLMSCGPRRKIGFIRCRCLSLALLKKLDLGPPIVPDIKKIIDNYTTELCLPTEFKNLVFSLMYLWPCDYLDLDSRSLKAAVKMPDYEGTAMAYIVVALKMCFGLDDDYEYKLSDIVDKINEMEKFSKCYKIGFTPEPTGRIFSFREWIIYLQFRRKKLIKHRLISSDDEHYLDVDDYIYMEYLTERQKKGTITMTDELSMDIVNKLDLGKEIDVIPKNSFPPTFTPLTTYTEVLSEHCRHTKDVEMLSEDFTQYSLKYACESLCLSALDNDENVVKGVTDQGKIISDAEVMCGYLNGIKNNRNVNMVYVMNCQNKNWLKTNKPTIDHVIIDSKEKSNAEEINDESDLGYDSNLPSTPSDKDVPTEVGDEEPIRILDTIQEEDEDKNIFDDAFENIQEKDESDVLAEADHDLDNGDRADYHDNQNNLSDDEDRKSVSSTETFEFNPETFNRERATKELILRACKKYKIPIPKEYRTTEPRKRKRDNPDEAEHVQRKHMKTGKRGEVKDKVNQLLQAYYNHLEKDVLNQVSHQLSMLMHNMNQTKQEDNSDNADYLNQTEPNNSTIPNYSNVSEISAIAPESSQVNITNLEEGEGNVESTLFNDDSDCENVEDLTITNDPKFDEAKYDVNQLYIKMDDAEPEDIYESLRDPELDKIIEKKIEECREAEITIKAKDRRPACSDSEDEIPLSVLKDDKVAYYKKFNEKLKPLITNDIPDFKYWVKRYNTVYMAREQNVHEKFDSEIAETMPKSFSFLLRECATIAGCTQFIIYKCMQNIEKNLVFCANSSPDE